MSHSKMFSSYHTPRFQRRSITILDEITRSKPFPPMAQTNTTSLRPSFVVVTKLLKLYSKKYHLPESFISKCFDSFHAIDEDHNGTLNKYELLYIMNGMGYSVSEKMLNDVMSQYDTNGDGVVDFEDFLVLVKDIRFRLSNLPLEEYHQQGFNGHQNKAEIIRAFEVMGGGKNGSGKIDVNKLEKVIQTFGLKIQAKEIMKQLDVDNNGEIDIFEFTEFLSCIKDKHQNPKKRKSKSNMFHKSLTSLERILMDY